jgi:large subunit ribosomal protein L27e
MKPGRVVILLAGRRAGKKAVIVKQFDEGKKGKLFSHALVAGVERAPLRVTKRMSKNKIKRRSTLKPFAKIVNYNHILPTRFQVTGEFAQSGHELKTVVTEDKMANKDTRKKLKNEIKAIFTER